MSKALNTIQILAKIGKIISKIIFICCIVGASLCAVGIISVAVGADGVLKIGGVSIHGLVEYEAGMTTAQMIGAMVAVMISLIAEAVLAKLAENYFKHELDAGTPFTFEGAKEIMRLGILAIALPIGAEIIAAIVYGIIDTFVPVLWDIDISIGDSISVGVMFIVASVIFRYGAELLEQRESAEEKTHTL